MKKSKKRKLKKRKQKNLKATKRDKVVISNKVIKPTLLEQLKRKWKQFPEDHFMIYPLLDTLFYMIIIYGSIALLYIRTN